MFFHELVKDSMDPVATFSYILDLTPDQLTGLVGADKKARNIEHKTVPGPEFYVNLMKEMGLDRESKLAAAKRKMKEMGLGVCFS